MKNINSFIVIAMFAVAIVSCSNQTNKPTVEDRMDIADLMNGWMHRDLGEWDALRALFVPEGTIEVSWYEGPINGFIEGSKRLAETDIKSKHFIGMPIVTFNGNKAIAETNAEVMGENTQLGLGNTVQVRFYDMLEKRNGEWKILRRQVIYDMGRFEFPRGPVEIDTTVLNRYPHEYAAMAYCIGQTGVTIDRVFATKGSELEIKMKREGKEWLNK